MPMTRLLATTDFSTRAALALQRAAALGNEFNAALHLLHVVDEELPADTTARAETRLQQEAEKLRRDCDINPVSTVLCGAAFEVIVQAANDGDVQLIVMGAHRRKLLRDVFVGTTIERVMRTGHLPVLMVNIPTAGAYQRILIATDMSEASATALCAARNLGLLDKADVTLLHAFEPLAKALMIHANIERERIEEHVANEIRQVRQQLTAFLADLNFDTMSHTTSLEQGGAFECLNKAVERLQPDLVVIGTRGQSGPRRVLLGSVADAALRKLNCDILAVPPHSGKGPTDRADSKD